MVVHIVPDYESLSQKAASLVADAIRGKTDLVLGLAAGNTPAGTYRELVRMHREAGLDFSRVVCFNLDEYGEIDPTDPRSFTAFLHENLLDRINVNSSNVHLLTFPSEAAATTYCQAIEDDIRRVGGIDLQILGIGRNGHIAFNEPGSTFYSRTRIVNLLAPETPDTPRTAVTLGIATILESRRLLLLCAGEQKAEILAKALHGPIDEGVPASVLQRHPEVTVIADQASAAYLSSGKP
jgi:glucosamine-6-phosphate deaminase